MKKATRGKISNYLNIAGNVFIGTGFLFLFFTFAPVFDAEVKYQVREAKRTVVKKFTDKTEDTIYVDEEPTLTNTDFSIFIPKINAAAPIVKNVNPFDESTFLPALKKGVAHAVNSSLPSEEGNVYLFAHSTDAFYNVGIYNAVFYLIGKLDPGDEVIIYFEDKEYTYRVFDKRVVDASEVKYLEDFGIGHPHSLTLQTCYPPGTTLKRLVVLADLVDN